MCPIGLGFGSLDGASGGGSDHRREWRRHDSRCSLSREHPVNGQLVPGKQKIKIADLALYTSTGTLGQFVFEWQIHGDVRPGPGCAVDVDPARQLLQFGHRVGQSRPDARQLTSQVAPAGGSISLREARRQSERDQPLLGAVVQVTLDPPPGGPALASGAFTKVTVALCLAASNVSRPTGPGHSCPLLPIAANSVIPGQPAPTAPALMRRPRGPQLAFVIVASVDSHPCWRYLPCLAGGNALGGMPGDAEHRGLFPAMDAGGRSARLRLTG
jgi:hypothetical protein